MLLTRSPTTYRRDRLAVNMLVLAVVVVWSAAILVHVAMWATQGRLW